MASEDRSTLPNSSGLVMTITTYITRCIKALPMGTAPKIFSAFFYAFASLSVIFANKALMNNYNFPYVGFLATVQFLSTTLVLSILVYFKQIEVPKLSMALFREIAPISLMFLGNIISGLYGTRGLSLPMFTAIRRFSISMTMLTEWAVLGTNPNLTMIYSVITMVGGGFIAALYDISYDTMSYIMVMANNTFTALNGMNILFY